MKHLFTSNGWRITQNEDLMQYPFFSIDRFYPSRGWVAFKSPVLDLQLCFLWLYRWGFIGEEEYNHQISLIEKR